MKLGLYGREGLQKYQAMKRGAKQDIKTSREIRETAGALSETPCTQKGKKFYLPHRAVVREGVESTKVHIIYDAN